MQFNFDATNIEPDVGGFGDPLPKSWFLMSIDDSEMKETKDKTGAYLSLRFSAMQGPFANRKLFNNYNVQNANPQTVEIAKKQLSAICHAIGQLTLTDSAQLHGRPMWVKVGIEPGGAKPEGGSYPDRNKIITIKDANFQPPASEGINGEGAVGAAAPAAAAAQPGNPFAGMVAAPAAAPVAAAPLAAAPQAAPPVPAAPVAPPVPAAPVAFPPAGWTAHPQAPGYFYKDQEVLTEADLRARMAPAVPAAPALPVAPPVPAAAPVAAAPAVANPAATAATLTPPWATGQ